ncbi:MAG: nuclear transport factor 2 family protein [Gemmatimonadota bacterium]
MRPREGSRREGCVWPRLALVVLLACGATPVAADAQGVLAGAPPRAESASNPERFVVAVLTAAFSATERADYTALDSLFAGEDLTIIEGAGIDRTWTEYRDHHLRPELEEFEAFSYVPHDIEAHVAGNLGWALFEYDLAVRVKERSIERVGRGTAIFEKRGGRWVIRHLQTANRPRD